MLKPTSMGLDDLPDWYIRIAAPAFAQPLTYLFNLSLECSVVPHQWKRSCITPIPKVPSAVTCHDYRPISVTPILSRIMEKSLVKLLLYPVLTHPDYSHLFSDQFGFRPTGSTTAALIYLLHQVSCLLQEHEYVHIIGLDFSKAFDTVRHYGLVSKMGNFPLPDCFHNWLIDYLYSREHQTKVGDQKSAFLSINASIIQGSGLGPTSYIFNASDLHPVYRTNIIFKYADDTYLLVPARNSDLISEELASVSRWASENNMTLNSSKCREMIVCLSSANHLQIPPPCHNIIRVEEMTILGVSFTHTLSFAPHVLKVASKAGASLYALKTLKAHGLNGQALCDVAKSTLVAQILYACPVWSGFLRADEKAKLQSILHKAIRYNYLPTFYHSIDELFESYDGSMFSIILNNSQHVLFPLLPPPKETGYNLRKSSHGLMLPTAQSSLLRKNFIYRMLYRDIY